jgi:hypothetical protein
MNDHLKRGIETVRQAALDGQATAEQISARVNEQMSARAPRASKHYGMSNAAVLAMHRPFAQLSNEQLACLTLSYIICKRATPLRPEPDHLYLIISGSAAEAAQLDDAPHPCHIKQYGRGEVIGWTPLTGYIEQGSETHYLAISPGWQDIPLLNQFQSTQQADEMRRLKRMLAVMMTCNVKTRMKLIPHRPGASITDMAKAIGASREMVSRALAEGDTHRK